MYSDVLIIPPGKKTGCLPRKSKPGEVCPLFAERIKVIPSGEWEGLIAKGIALRPHVHEILDQNGVGSCAAEAANGTLMVGRSMNGQEHITMNPWATYHFTSGGRDGGSSIDDNLIHLRDVGAIPMDLWPRSKGWRTRPDQQLLDEVAPKYRVQEFFDISTVEEFGTALLLGMAVAWGWSGHSCFAVDLIDRNTFRYANSWHESWGDHGFGTLALRSINWGYGAWAIRGVTDAGEKL